MFAPITGPTASRIRRSVGTLNTRWSGWSSNAMCRTPFASAWAAISCQNGMATSHWRASSAIASSGHG